MLWGGGGCPPPQVLCRLWVARLGGVHWWEGGGFGSRGYTVHPTVLLFMMGDSFGPGIDVFDSDPNFNFLSKIQNDSNSDDDFIYNLDFSPYSEININCSYAEPNHLTHLNNTNLSVLSLNIQSLSAKFLTFMDMQNDLSSSNVIPDIICLQEVWQIPDPSLFCIPNYQPILFNLRASAKGGGCGYLC